MSDRGAEEEELRSKVRHDIKNQLSNIHLALETLKFEVPNPSDDYTFCLETIFTSAAKIKLFVLRSRIYFPSHRWRDYWRND